MSDLKLRADAAVEAGLVKRADRHDAAGNLIHIYKYTRKVFYKNLWHKDDILRECRGLVLAENGDVIQRPFHKMFNIGENHTKWPDRFRVVRKVNGFMCAATSHLRQLFISTTGSVDSDFAHLARTYFTEDIEEWILMFPDYTFLFEVVDPDDPHIVAEDRGLYLLAMRHKEFGKYVMIDEMVDTANVLNFPEMRVVPSSGILTKQNDIRDLMDVKHEGWAIWNAEGTIPLAKVKTPHYLSKKAMMRMGKNACNQMFNNTQEFKERLDEEFYDLLEFVLREFTQEEWSELDEQQRRQIIEEYFYG